MTANLLQCMRDSNTADTLLDLRPHGSGERQSFECAEKGCGIKVLLEPSNSSEDPRATIVQASFAHNHPLVLEEDARYRLDAWVRESEEKLRLRALEQLKKLKKGYDYQLVSAVTIPIHETFAMQTEILDNIGKILVTGNEADSERVWSLRGGRCIAKLSAASPPARSPSATPPAPQGKAKKKDKKRAPPSPSPTPVAGPSDKRVKREVSKKREVLVLDESDEEDVKPEVRSSRQEQQANQQQPPAAPPADAPAQSDLVAFLTSLPPFPYEQYAHLFSRRTIRIDSSQQLLKFVTAVPPCFDTLSTELGKDEVKADGTIEEGMPMLWRMMLHSELLKRVQEEQ
ncbi:hypothetical protein JCM10049v2_004337 [Rhodotorula toruloides]